MPLSFCYDPLSSWKKLSNFLEPKIGYLTNSPTDWLTHSLTHSLTNINYYNAKLYRTLSILNGVQNGSMWKISTWFGHTYHGLVLHTIYEVPNSSGKREFCLVIDYKHQLVVYKLPVKLVNTRNHNDWR